MAIFFTSDTHFYHKNIILYCDRPWRTEDGQPDVPAMNAGLIERWNAVVGKDDTVYHLGDFGFGNPNKLAEIREQLNGKMILVRGNHDHKLRKWLLPTDEWYRELVIGDRVYLTHVPPVEFDGRFPVPVPPEDTSVVLCGHVHNKWNKAATANGRLIVNVGCDIFNWTPVTPEKLGVERYIHA